MSATKKGTFTAPAQSDDAHGDICDVFLSGTFAGTVALEVQDTVGNWNEFASWTAPVASLNNQAAMARNWRLNCSALSSGTANYEISTGLYRDLKR